MLIWSPADTLIVYATLAIAKKQNTQKALVEESKKTKKSNMKRTGNLYNQICTLENLRIADSKARKGKSRQSGVIQFDKNKEQNLIDLHQTLINKEFKTSQYHIFQLHEGKTRTIHELPYFPDRIVHHAIMNVMEDYFLRWFTADTYSSIKKKGIHKCLGNVTKALKDKEGTKYCLKMDIRKFYLNVNHDILKSQLRRKIKDWDILVLLDEIIDSTEGVPLGNYLSQNFANFYTTTFDHWLKEDKKIKNYFKYMDDMVILHESKEYLHDLRKEIQEYLRVNLKLELSNYQVFPVESRGIDFVGYVSFHDHIRLRKSIKQRFKRMIKYRRNEKSIASYNGWLSHGNCINLMKKYYLQQN